MKQGEPAAAERLKDEEIIEANLSVASPWMADLEVICIELYKAKLGTML